MTLQKWAIFIMGVYGESSHLFVGSYCNFVSDYIKNVDTHHESFSSKKKPSNKKIIAKKPLKNLYEMNSNESLEVRSRLIGEQICGYFKCQNVTGPDKGTFGYTSK